ncbi:MAG: hypothetical protein KatS3mg022_0511 [Armatimonadota bacterium]|nr:MAG: hypothetical protein KatS3mg022_0511 [Armatimonadota bacterium]
MKRIECIIRPFKLDEVKLALSDLGVVGMTVTDVRGRGSNEESREHYRGAGYTIYLPPKVKIEMIVRDEDVEPIVQTVLQYARTGEPGRRQDFHPAGRGRGAHTHGRAWRRGVVNQTIL